MRVPIAAGLAWLCLLSACDSPTRTLGVGETPQPTIRKNVCYDPCVISVTTALAYVASARVTDLGVLPGDSVTTPCGGNHPAPR